MPSSGSKLGLASRSSVGCRFIAPGDQIVFATNNCLSPGGLDVAQWASLALMTSVSAVVASNADGLRSVQRKLARHWE
jgi:hypothetical protein